MREKKEVEVWVYCENKDCNYYEPQCRQEDESCDGLSCPNCPGNMFEGDDPRKEFKKRGFLRGQRSPQNGKELVEFLERLVEEERAKREPVFEFEMDIDLSEADQTETED